MSFTLESAPERVRDSRYWLRHCEGFRVDGVDGRVGFVEEAGSSVPSTQAATLVVRAGLFSRRLLIFAVAEIADILPAEKRVLLRSPLKLLDSEQRREIGG